MKALKSHFDTVILGAGPAGTGPLVSAARAGQHAQFLATGVLWVDAGDAMAVGTLGQFDIRSDTMAKVFIECLRGDANPLAPLRLHPATLQLERAATDSVPLSVAVDFLRALGQALERLVQASTHSDFWPRCRALGLKRLASGLFAVSLSNGSMVTARQILFAMGGQPQERFTPRAMGLTDADLHQVPAERRISSHRLLQHGGLQAIGEQLPAAARVVVVGASHSALTVASRLLEQIPDKLSLAGSVTLLCRRMPKMFYPSPEAALAEGYTAFSDDDVCPLTHRVYRLAGMRMGSRELLRKTLRLGDAAFEPRVRLLKLSHAAPGELQALLAGADLVVTALGYRPRVIPVQSAGGQRIFLAADVDPSAPLVNDGCQVLDGTGAPIAGLYGMGLASGFIPRGPVYGGESSFVGQTNGLWLYQHDLGDHLHRVLMTDAAATTGAGSSARMADLPPNTAARDGEVRVLAATPTPVPAQTIGQARAE